MVNYKNTLTFQSGRKIVGGVFNPDLSPIGSLSPLSRFPNLTRLPDVWRGPRASPLKCIDNSKIYHSILCILLLSVSICFDLSAQETELILVPAGTFTMGSENRAADEKPMHKVYLDAYYIGKYEVTNAEYYEFWKLQLENNSPEKTLLHTPENFPHLSHIGDWPARAEQFPNHPVVGVSWHDAAAYAVWKGMRLPTEAEWEKAARGYTNRIWPWGSAMEPRANTVATDDGYENRIAPVGSFPRGKSYYGAMDMAGNVWEWTADWYSDVYYWYSSQAAAKRPKRNPTGPGVGSWRVIRGGSWLDTITRCSTTFRFYLYPNLKTSFVGFRLAKTAEKTTK